MTATLQVQHTLRLRVGVALSTSGQCSHPVPCLLPPVAATPSSYTNPSGRNTELKATDGLAGVVLSIEKVMDKMRPRKNYYMMTLTGKDLEEEMDGFQRQGQTGW